MKKLLQISVILSILCSCEIDITDEFKNTPNLFVVSGQIVAGEVPRINLSKTITLVEFDTLRYINDAHLEIKKNNSLFVLDPEEEGFYKNGNLVPGPGDLLSLDCSGEGMPPASIAIRVPEYPQITNITFLVDSAYDFSLEVEFEDPVSTLDHYTFYLSGWRREIVHHHDSETEEEWIDTSQVYVNYSIWILDPVMEYTGDGPRNFQHYDLSQAWGSSFHFSDKEINGKSHTLTGKGSLFRIYNDTIPEIHVHIIKKDVHYFNFISSYIHYDPYPDQDFIQPIQGYSNIEGGFGLLTAESRIVDTIDVSEWYNDPDFQALVNPVPQ